MVDLHEHLPAAQPLRIVVPRQFGENDGRLSELATLALEFLEARLAARGEATAAVNDMVEAAFGGSRVDAARVGEAILACLRGEVARSATAPSE